tara:strand:+ start:134 stop:1183 length:1050 start_codon:yes stop_codon:yes gene_type:complete
MMRSIYLLFSFSTILIIVLIYFGLNGHWILGILGLSLPILIAVHIFIFLGFLLFNPKEIFTPLVVLLFCSIFYNRTFQFRNKDTSSNAPNKEFKLLSYNVGNTHRNNESAESYRDWLGATGADVMVLPEFSSLNTGKFIFKEYLATKGYKYMHTLVKDEERGKNYITGLTIFSRHPIVFVKDSLFQELNGIVRADIKMGHDTVSVFAVHLYSMRLRLDNLIHQRHPDLIEAASMETLQKIKSGFVHRKKEVDLLLDWVSETPYPAVIGGDFNETPYSYSYSNLDGRFKNAFEEKGSGFGFTFAGLPKFIRIDHQFFDPQQIEVLHFKTMNTVKHSDHFPILGTYKLIEK